MMERMHRTFVMIMVVAIPLLSACATVGPDYMRPAVQTPAAFKEMEGWKATEPRDSESKGPWWEIYADPLLNELEAQVDVANQTVAQAEAQYRQARALVAIARAGYFQPWALRRRPAVRVHARRPALPRHVSPALLKLARTHRGSPTSGAACAALWSRA
jgi:hypothetical protein